VQTRPHCATVRGLLQNSSPLKVTGPANESAALKLYLGEFMTFGRWIRSLFAAVILSVFAGLPLATSTLAADLSGMNLTAHATFTTMARNSVRDTVTWTLQIYFGTKGNRFVLLQGSRGSQVIKFTENRILIPAGSNKGSKRRKDNNFNYVITLKQSASGIEIFWDSRGRDTRFANETYKFWLSLGNGSCRLDNFRYNPDARLNYISVVEKPGDCTLTKGLPSDLPSDN
jgi:hypothetical protein